MSQRSPYNDRYKVDQKGKTRKSASAAKPKRAVAEVGTGTRKKAAKSTAWGRAKAASKSSARPATHEPKPSARMKQLRKFWWIAWVIALGVAVAILGLQTLGAPWVNYVPVGWALWLISMGAAFYLEFVPIRKERALMLEAAKSGGSHKAEKAAARAGAKAEAKAEARAGAASDTDRAASGDGEADE